MFDEIMRKIKLVKAAAISSFLGLSVTATPSMGDQHFQLRGAVVTQQFFEALSQKERFKVQRTLQIYGFFGHPFFEGNVDGLFGQETHMALNNLASLWFDHKFNTSVSIDDLTVLGDPQSNSMFFQALLDGTLTKELQPDLCIWECFEGTLPETALREANLTGADLTAADMTGVDLTGADLTGTDLTKANLTRADLSETTLTRADLSEANLTEAILIGVNMHDVFLEGTNFCKTLTPWGEDYSDCSVTSETDRFINDVAFESDQILSMSINACWSVDPGAEWAPVTVTVGFSLGQDGRVIGDVRMISASGGNDAQISNAFQAARRAILRCQSSGYKLPPEKYDQWQNVEITFDPTGMRLR